MAGMEMDACPILQKKLEAGGERACGSYSERVILNSDSVTFNCMDFSESGKLSELQFPQLHNGVIIFDC